MAQLDRRYRAQAKQTLALLGVSPREHEVLLIVGREGNPGPSTIARHAGVSRQLIHRVLLDLEARRLVQRWSYEPGHVCVGLTRSGESVLKRAEDFADAGRAVVLRQLGVERLLALEALLGALEHALDEAHRRPELVDG